MCHVAETSEAGDKAQIDFDALSALAVSFVYQLVIHAEEAEC